VAVSITTATGAIYIFDQYHKEIEAGNTLLSDTQRIAETLAYVATPYLIESNYVFLNKLVSADKLHTSYAYIAVTDEKNRVLAHSGAGKNLQGVLETPAQQVAENAGKGTVRRYRKNGKEHIEVSQPVKAGDLVIGSVRIGLSTEWLQKMKIKGIQTVTKMSIIPIVIMFLGVISAVLIADRIAKPILLLKQKAERVGKGDYTQDIHLSRNDEVGILASSFNLMLADLRQSSARLENKTRALEDSNLELQRLNKELHLRRKEAEVASKAKTDFLANVSHELRTPLNAIIGFSDIMVNGMTGPLTDEQLDFTRDIGRSGKHLLILINDILDLSKVEAGKMELDPGPVQVQELIESSLVMFREKVKKHQINIDCRVADGITQITADQMKLKRVLVNLLSNAFRYTPDGGSVHILARKVRSAELDRNFLEISVADHGPGIRAEDFPKLFQPFQQLETSLSRKVPGTGLGLSLCRKLIELHGGKIWVESEVGKGSKFLFVLPMAKGEV